MRYGILNSTYYFGNSESVTTHCCSECESVSAVTDSIKYGSVVGSYVSKNPTVELEQLTTVV